jgi:GntR family transcriptional regulator
MPPKLLGAQLGVCRDVHAYEPPRSQRQDGGHEAKWFNCPLIPTSGMVPGQANLSLQAHRIHRSRDGQRNTATRAVLAWRGTAEGPGRQMPTARYRQIADDLQKKIAKGELGADGKPLPSEKELVELYKASRNTVREAIKWLSARRVIETKPPQGTFILNLKQLVIHLDDTKGFGGDGARYASEVEATNRQASVSDPKIEIQLAAAAMVDEELELDASATVLSRNQDRFIEDDPWSMQTTFYPMTLVARGAQRLIEAANIPEGTVQYLKDELGIEQVGFRDLLSVRPPDSNETEFFQLPEDGSVAVFETRRIGYEKGPNGHIPLRLTVTVFPADRNKFVFDVGDVPDPKPA